MVANLAKRRGRGRPPKYPEWLKKQALDLVENNPSRTLKSISGELGVGYDTLKLWVAANRKCPAALTDAPGEGKQTESPSASVPPKAGGVL